MASVRSFALVAMLVVLLQVLARSTLAQQTQEQVRACITAGGSIQSACSNELNLVSAVSQGKQTVDQVLGSLSPSPACCKAACEFTRQLCGCNDQIVKAIQDTYKLDLPTTGRMLSSFAAKCRFPALSRANNNCPATASFTC